jgi:hypothetical protein
MSEVELQEPTPAALPAPPAPDGNPFAMITAASSDKDGLMITKQSNLALVVQSAQESEKFIQAKQWALLWRDADLLYQSPRPMDVYENTYVITPNVQRFTVAKVCNAVVPQLYKGLFYDDPPMLMRPRPGTSQTVVDAKTAIFSFLLDECNFKTQVKWGLEQMAHLGTGIFKWGYDWKPVITRRRKATTTAVDSSNADGTANPSVYPTDEAPSIVETSKVMPLPTFEWRPLDKVFVDTQLSVSDIRKAKWVIDVRDWDWYEFSDMKKAVEAAKKQGANDENVTGWNFWADGVIKALWNQPNTAPPLVADQAMYVKGAVHHAEEINIQNSPDPLRKKLEVLEYWDNERKVLVLNRKYVIFEGKNEFKKIPFLSANWWNRPKAFYGMGLGLIVGQNQRVDQGTINAILKILSFGVNPIYLRARDENAPTQMIRTGLGKILSVTDIEKSYGLLETPKVPSDVWSALKESEQATESSSGADAQLVQGSSAGPRSSMGRTAGGANILAGASATRLDGPLDNFIEQVFKPFLGVLDYLTFNIMSDAAVLHLLGKEMGQDFLKTFKLQEYHDAQIEYEVLAGSSLAAKRTMAQSMVMLTQILENQNLQELLAQDGKKIKMEPIIAMWLEASEWKNKNDIVVDMTPDEKAERKANSKAALQAQMVQAKQQGDQQKFAQKQQLEDQASDNRIKRDITREAAKASGMSEAVEGVPSAGGLQGTLPTVA